MDPALLEPIDAEVAAEQRREEAFTAAPFQWKDITLAPLAIGREGDWLLHCRRIGLPSIDEVINSAEMFLPFAQRLLWFCAHPARIWLAAWMKGGQGAPIILEAMIEQWAAQHILPGDQVQVLKTALDLYDRAHATHANRSPDDEEDDPEEGNAFGPRHELSTSASSRGPAPASAALSSLNTGSTKAKAGPSSTVTASAKVRSTSGRKPSTRKKRRSARG